MGGVMCTCCGRSLSKPFTVTVFTPDGLETVTRNEIPNSHVDGDGAVILYRHDVCDSRATNHIDDQNSPVERRFKRFISYENKIYSMKDVTMERDGTRIKKFLPWV
jgi:hypothetical protein